MAQSQHLTDLIERARHVKMSPQARRAQRRSLIRGLSGNSELTDERIVEVLPELAD